MKKYEKSLKAKALETILCEINNPDQVIYMSYDWDDVPKVWLEYIEISGKQKIDLNRNKVIQNKIVFVIEGGKLKSVEAWEWSSDLNDLSSTKRLV